MNSKTPLKPMDKRGPEAEPLVRRSGGKASPEAESFLRIGHSNEGARSTLRH